jgi:hypothetical protein
MHVLRDQETSPHGTPLFLVAARHDVTPAARAGLPQRHTVDWEATRMALEVFRQITRAARRNRGPVRWYKGLDVESLHACMQRYDWKGTKLDAASSILSTTILMHPFPNANHRTSIALASTLLALGFSVGLAAAFVRLASLFGTGSEAAFYLQYGGYQMLNLRGLLLGGIIVGTLGVLDDITTAQVATVEEISIADPRLSFAELYRRGLSVGREHIASLVNTLALAYAGASLPLFLIFSINKVQPIWVILNGEPVAEEFVRTLVGSSGLIIAVPISTWLAAYFFSRRPAGPERASPPRHDAAEMI